MLAASCWAGETQLGKPLALQQETPIGRILKEPATFVGKPVQVRGKVVELCERMGCWMNLVDADGRRLRIKVKDGDIVFPQSALGKQAIAEGTLTKLELNLEQARAYAKHEAEEQGRAFKPESIKTGTTLYQIQGSGAVIVE